MKRIIIQPKGDLGKTKLVCFFGEDNIIARAPIDGPQVAFDWWNDRLQALVFSGDCDDPALHVRYNMDGTIAEILLRDDLRDLVKSDCGIGVSEWQRERDERGDPKLEALNIAQKRINNRTQMSAFFDALNKFLIFHPDTKLKDYVRLDSKEKSFTKAEAAILQRAMNRCFELCAMWDEDIYAIGLESMQRCGLAPKP